MAVACFYFDFTAEKEQVTTDVLEPPPKEVSGRMERIPDEMVRDFQKQKRVIMDEHCGFRKCYRPHRPPTPHLYVLTLSIDVLKNTN